MSSAYEVVFRQFWCHNCQKSSNRRIEGEQINSEQFCQQCNTALEWIKPNDRQAQQFVVPTQRLLRMSVPIFYHIITFHMSDFQQQQNESQGATDEQISRLQHRTNEPNSGLSCYICQDDFNEGEQMIELQCKHAFHGECITKWLKLNNTCPICRQRQQ